MKKVKAIQAKRTVEGIFEEGDIFIQFFDQPFIFYPEGSDASGGGIDIRLMDKRGGYLKYFNDIEPVDISENEYYQRRVWRKVGTSLLKVGDRYLISRF
jgi:hypothetical protein